MMRRRTPFRLFFLAAALACLPALALAAEEQSLLTTDGTLHVVRSGKAADLGIADPSVAPEDLVIEWSSRAQDGTISVAVVPGTGSAYNKRGLQLAFDEATSTLLLLWTQDMSAYSQIRVGVLHEGVWTNSGLLPNQGLSGAYNPRMVLTHQAVTHLDEKDMPVAKTTSILSIIWWEDAQYGQARYATLFLDEDSFDTKNLAIYDLPVLLGGGGATSYDGVAPGAYLYPSLQADGLSGAVVASFADLHEQRHKVVRINFPDDHGKPSEPGNLKWQRRHIPIVGVTMHGPLAQIPPSGSGTLSAESAVGTSIGSGYRPTLYWRDAEALKFTRLEGAGWTAVRSIAIDETMTYEKALALVVGMGTRN